MPLNHGDHAAANHTPHLAADRGIRAVLAVVGPDTFAAEPFGDSISDTLVDVLHFAASVGLDLRAECARAVGHVEAERDA